MVTKIVKYKYYSYSKYKNDIVNVYTDERLEPYYYPVLKEFLLSLCSDDIKVVCVSENKNNSGIHATLKKVYSDYLQDLIIVPKSHTYENPQKPYVTIEVKRPDIDIKDEIITRYNKVKVKSHERQLVGQFNTTNFIIFTDCITWYLLSNEDGNIKIEKEICLIEPVGKIWIWKSELNNFSNEDRVYYKEVVDSSIRDEIENNPNYWNNLTINLKNFIEQSKKC